VGSQRIVAWGTGNETLMELFDGMTIEVGEETEEDRDSAAARRASANGVIEPVVQAQALLRLFQVIVRKPMVQYVDAEYGSRTRNHMRLPLERAGRL